MTDPAPGASGYTSTNLPRGLHVVNRWITNNQFSGITNSWQGYIVGRMVDPIPGTEPFYSYTSTITAFNAVGTNQTNLVLTLIHNGNYPNSSTNTAAPVPYGVTTFNATNNQVFSNALFYSNTPSYWTATGLPAGLALSVDLNAAGTDVQASIVGTPTGGSGTMTATIKAVNVLSDAPYNSMPATNTNIITFNFGGGSGFATWGGGVLPAVGTAAYTNALLRYAFGGQAYDGGSTTQTNFGTASLSNISGIDYLVLREIIRTNDPNLNVWSEHTTNLTNSTWTSNNLPPTASADQTGATAGTQAQDFKTPQGSGERKFLRLKATYQNP